MSERDDRVPVRDRIYWDYGEAAEMLGLSKRSLQRRRDDDKAFPCDVRVGGRKLLYAEDVRAYALVLRERAGGNDGQSPRLSLPA